jgi:flagellar biogenesis protein FliO
VKILRRKRLLILLFPVLCLGVLFFSWGNIHGSDSESAGHSPKSGFTNENMDMSALALRVVLALGSILLLILGAAYLLRFMNGRAGNGAGRTVRVLDRCYLAPKRALYTVRFGERVLVVGVTESTITPVLELSEEERERFFPKLPDSEEEAVGFPAILKEVALKIARPRP